MLGHPVTLLKSGTKTPRDLARKKKLSIRLSAKYKICRVIQVLFCLNNKNSDLCNILLHLPNSKYRHLLLSS